MGNGLGKAGEGGRRANAGGQAGTRTRAGGRERGVRSGLVHVRRRMKKVHDKVRTWPL